MSTINSLFKEAENMGLCNIHYSDNIKILNTPVQAGKTQLVNRMVIQPMEGCDGLPDGKPGELTQRRYQRFANR